MSFIIFSVCICLFGSYLKDKPRKKSDIDILVTFNKESFDNYMDLLFLLEKLFRRKKSSSGGGHGH